MSDAPITPRPPSTPETDPMPADPDRREALAKLTAWTAPILLTLLLSPRASATSVPPDPP